MSTKHVANALRVIIATAATVDADITVPMGALH
jgi:hypothetical protein